MNLVHYKGYYHAKKETNSTIRLEARIQYAKETW